MQKNPFCKGNLYIKIDIEFPADGSLSPAAIAQIHSVLPQGNTPMIPGDAEECVLRPGSLEELGGGENRRNGATDEDGDDDMRGGQRVGCQQQ